MRPQQREAGHGRAVQSQIYRHGAYGRRPKVPVDAGRLARAASRRMSSRAAAYVAGSAGNEDTARANRAAFQRHRIVPRMLTDVSRRDHGIELFGRRLRWPFLLAPIGVLELVHPDADLAVARAAAELGMPMVQSNQASRSMEDCAAVMAGADRWFQLYWSSDDDLVRSLVSRAEASGCRAIVVTVDTHMLGWRPRDLDQAFLPFAYGQGLAQYTSDPVFTELVRQRAKRPRQPQPRPTLAAIRTLLSVSRHYPGKTWANLRSPLPRAAVETFLDVFSRSSLTWENLSFLRECTSLPILVKGILHPQDARRAVSAGVDGIVVSNHGGRQVDGAIAALDALPDVVAEAGELPVLFDSGIRGGADVFKAIALGARAVCVGRPYVYGLALAGAPGVVEVMGRMAAEFDLTMGLAGCASITEIGPHTMGTVS
jgi:lactate 2-monooxygenase